MAKIESQTHTNGSSCPGEKNLQDEHSVSLCFSLYLSFYSFPDALHFPFFLSPESSVFSTANTLVHVKLLVSRETENEFLKIR